jgi:hypothetical protein
MLRPLLLLPMMPHFLSRSGLAALTAGALVSLSPELALAEQFVLFDATFEYTWQDAINATPSKSHYYVKETNGLNTERPDNWVSPVDYRNGKVHIHLEVLEKPAGGQMQGWALCYVGNAGSYGCPYTDYYTDVGVYEKEVDMTNFYNDDTIDWSQGIRQVDLVYTINGSGQGHVHFFPELQDKTTPTKVRIALVQVSAGATYNPNDLPGAGGAGGAGGGGVGGAGGAGMSGSPSGGAGASGTGGAQSPLGGNAGTASMLPGGGMPGAPAAGGAGGVASAGAPATPGLGAQPTTEKSSCSLGGTAAGRPSWLVAAALLLLSRTRRRLRA